MPSFFVYCFPSEFDSVACVGQEVCEALVSHPPFPENELRVEAGVEPTVQRQAVAGEEPTVLLSPRKRKGKEAASKAPKKAKPSAPLWTGGAFEDRRRG